jgi:hypothetical protein
MVVPPLAAVGAGLLATPETIGLGTIPAAAGGWAMGKGAVRVLDAAMGVGKQPQTIPQQAIQIAGDLAEGATYEMGGAVLGKTLEVGLPMAKNFIRPAFKSHEGDIRGALFGRYDRLTERKLYHGDKGGKLHSDPKSLNAEDPRTMFFTPDKEFASLPNFGGREGGGVLEGMLDSSAKILDIRTMSKSQTKALEARVKRIITERYEMQATLNKTKRVSPAVINAETKETMAGIKSGDWTKAEMGAGGKAIREEGYDAVTMAEAPIKTSLDDTGKVVFGEKMEPSMTIAVFNKSKIKNLRPAKVDPLEGFAGLETRKGIRGMLERNPVKTAGIATAVLGYGGNKAYNYTSAFMGSMLLPKAEIPPAGAAAAEVPPELTPAEIAVKAEVVAKAAEAKKGEDKERLNRHDIALSSSSISDGSLDSMRLQMDMAQAPYDAMNKGGEKGVRKYLKSQGLSGKELNSRTAEIMGSRDNNPILQSSNNTGSTSIANSGIMASSISKDLSPSYAANAMNEVNLRTINGGVRLNKDDVGSTVDLASVIKDDKGNYSGKTLTGSFGVGALSAEGKAIEAAMKSTPADLAKGISGKQFSLADEAAKGNVPAGATDAIVASNERLINSLDQLKISIDKASVKGTTGTTAGATAGATTVTVNAPITVSSTGNDGSTQDVSAVVTKVCNEFFTNEFNIRYAAAVNTVNV